jgi:hypothetical protein
MSRTRDRPQIEGNAVQQTSQPLGRMTQAARESRGASVLLQPEHPGKSQLLVPVKFERFGYHHVLHHHSAPREITGKSLYTSYMIGA